MDSCKITAYVGIGSNRGDRAAYLQQALRSLTATNGITDLRLSPVYVTEAVGAAGPGRFLNAVVELRTSLTPAQLLACLQSIEQALGRDPNRTGARTIDLDILFYGDLVCESETLTIPHPRLQARDFVLEPLSSLAPDLKHPVTGATTTELLDRLLHRDTTLTPYPFRFVNETETASQ